MKKIFIRKGILFFLYSFLLYAPDCFAKKASADLSQIDFSEKKSFPLDMEWEFYWNQFYYPGDFKNGTITEPVFCKPSSWNKNTDVSPQGFATYRITLKNVPDRDLMMDIYSVQTSCRIYIDDSLAVLIGNPGTDKISTVPANRDEQVLLPRGKKEIELIVHIANFHHRKGGFVHPFEIGDAHKIIYQRLVYSILDFIESSALFIIGLFLFALFIFRRKDLSVLYFSLFCLSLSFRPVISVNYLMASLIPDISWPLMLKMEYLAVLLPCLFMLLFIKKLFPLQLPDLVVKILKFILITMAGITLFFPPIVFSWLVPGLLVIIPSGVIIFAFVITRAAIAGVEGSGYAGAGLVILLLSLLLKVMVYASILPPLHVLITTMDIAFIFMMSLILGSRFSLQFVKVETLQKKAEAQHIEIEKKKSEVERQNKIVAEKNKEILDSINYARRIQAAILPPKKIIDNFFSEYFIYYRPKDIVAGDFYWFEKADNKIIFAAADCTGHGVPGAMVSVVCNNALTRSVREHGLTNPARILTKTRELIIEQFAKSDEEVKDGMDIALCSFDTQDRTLEYAGAHNSLYIINGSNLREVKADKQPVGVYSEKKDFSGHIIQMQKGESVYIFSDGFADQFGGSNGKKFKTAGFREMLLSLQHYSMSQQEKEIDKIFCNWKGDLEQLDDVLIIGIRI